MSYLGRVARRAAGARGAGGLTPAGASGSPLARFDQRLNMLGAPGRVGTLAAGVRADGEGSGVSGDDDIAFVAPAGEGEARAPGARPVATARVDGQAESAAPAAERSSSAEASPAAAAGEAGRAARRQRPAAPPPAAPEPRLDPADAASLPAARPPRAPAPAERVAATDASGAARAERPRRRATDAIAGAEGDRAATTPRAGSQPAGDPIADAFAKLERWMAAPPRQRRGQGGGEAGEPDTRNAPRVAVSGRTGAPASEVRRAGARAAGELAAPRTAATGLRIGRIDVQVVTPPPPAPPPVRRAGQGARVAPGAPTADSPAYLTFGLRQR